MKLQMKQNAVLITNVIKMVAVQYLLVLLFCIFGKDTNNIILCFTVLASTSKISARYTVVAEIK